MKKLIYLFVFIIAACGAKNDVIHPYDLTCEYLKNPKGIDIVTPRLSWKLNSIARSQVQTAYQILVASSLEKLNSNTGDLWDSQRIKSDQSLDVKYAGTALTSGQQCFWKVKTWDADNNESEWSTPASFSTGLLKAEDWKAKWIGLDKGVGADQVKVEKTKLSARYLRKEFETAGEVKRATAYMCGLGLSIFYINGEKADSSVLSPALSEYNKRSYYVTYDVTSLVKNGKNVIGVVLGNGRFFPMRSAEPFAMQGYGFPKLLFQMEIEYADGKKKRIISDESWKLTANGPIVYNSEYDGEYYDARKEMKGWNTVGFNDKGWMQPEIVKPSSPKLSAQMINPICVMETIKPIKILPGKNHTYIYDMGQNMVGWVKLNIKAPKGTIIKMHFAETLNKNNELYVANLRSADVTDYYVAKGEDNEQWEPSFTYHGFRFLELSGYPGTPDLSILEGKVVHDNLEKAGEFACSNDVINQIYRNCVWGTRGNYRSIPTDCPQRDERMGWLGDRAIGSTGESFMFNNAAFYSKWLQDIYDAQNEKGSIPDVAPTYWRIYNDNVTWAGTFVLLTNMLYQQYGDKEIIARNYEGMKKWMLYMKNNYCKDNMLMKDTYGDWCTPPESLDLIHSKDPNRITSGVLLSTTYFYKASLIMKKFAEVLQKDDDTKLFGALADQMNKGLNEFYFDKGKKQYSNNSATSSILPLAYRMVPEEYQKQIFDNLLIKLMSEADGHISCGLVGCQWINRVLSDFGRPDIAFKLASNTTYPSWGYMAAHGATTIWELWNGNTADPAMNSGNHVMLIGDLVIWLYEYLGAIRPDESDPGFKHIIMKPSMIEELKWVKSSHISRYGQIGSSWSIQKDSFIWDITVPVNSSATVFIPAKKDNISESGNKAAGANGVKYKGEEGIYSIYEIGSGSYHFTASEFSMPAKQQEFVSSLTVSPKDTTIALPGKIKVNINTATEGAEIHYTTDGTEPTKNSPVYKGPIELDHYCIITAKAFKDGHVPSQVACCMYDFYDPKINGWNYQYYEGKWNVLPDFSKLKPVKSGISTTLNVLNLKKTIHTVEDYFGFQFTGMINIPEDGEYSFYLSSDDGSRLSIDDKAIVVNDSIHGIAECHGTSMLKKGMHPIKVEYFEGNYGEGLYVAIKGPGIPFLRVPVALITKK